ncbi:MAG: hypothetical protein IPJ85_14025 [Flavobacteriales bacterium]|nr:hypothetical protein [Flavobacteriales bacterium]
MSARLRTRHVAFALLTGLGMACAAQDQQVDLFVFGTMKDAETGKLLDVHAADAIDQKWGRRVQATAGAKGKYELQLVRDAVWMLEFGAPGYATKRLRLDLHGPSAADWIGGFGMNIDITLHREAEDHDLSFGGKPFGICRYDSAAGNFVWDMEHTEAMKRELNAALKAKGESGGDASR